jgi:hypothetical protein
MGKKNGIRMGTNNRIDVVNVRLASPTVDALSVGTIISTMPSKFRREKKLEFLPTVPWPLIQVMVALPGKAGWVGLALLRLAKMRNTTTLLVNCSNLARQLGVNQKAVYHALTVLAAHKILATDRRRGSFANVTMLTSI